MVVGANGATDTTDLQKENSSNSDKHEAGFLHPGRGAKWYSVDSCYLND